MVSKYEIVEVNIMMGMKKISCIAIASCMILTACGSKQVEDVEEAMTMTDAVEEQDDFEENQVFYRKSDGIVEKCTIQKGVAVTDKATEEEIQQNQLNELLDDRILIWQDCFSENELNQDIWSFEEGYIRNDEPQYYTVGNSNLSISDGILTITAKNEKTEDDIKWTSASIQTKGKKQFCSGRIEAKIKFSNTTGQWGAFWAMGAWVGDRWPKAGEIDICEQYGKSESDYYKLTTTMHYADQNGNHAVFPLVEAHSYDNQLNDQLYHIFAAEWIDDSIKIYIDDNEIATYDIKSANYWKQFEQNKSSCNPFLLPQYLKLNLAVNPKVEQDTENPMKMEVDWVRVYAAQEVEDYTQIIPTMLGIDYVYNVADVDRIEISDLEWNGHVGDEIYLGAVYFPKTVVDRTCEFTVDDDSIVTIDRSTGKMTVKKDGNVTVTVYDTASGVSASRKLHITIEK